MPKDELTPERCRQEAMDLRKAAGVVRDQRLAEQLLTLADQYEAAATRIEAGDRTGAQTGRKKAAH